VAAQHLIMHGLLFSGALLCINYIICYRVYCCTNQIQPALKHASEGLVIFSVSLPIVYVYMHVHMCTYYTEVLHMCVHMYMKKIMTVVCM